MTGANVCHHVLCVTPTRRCEPRRFENRGMKETESGLYFGRVRVYHPNLSKEVFIARILGDDKCTLLVPLNQMVLLP